MFLAKQFLRKVEMKKINFQKLLQNLIFAVENYFKN